MEKIELPDELKEGVVLHRIIDKISDRNENFLNELLTEKFGIFKGIVSDMYIDHFLSKNFDSLFNDNLNNIENKILYNIKINEKFFPDNFKRTFQWLKSGKVMSSYQNINFLERAFYGISQRVRKGEILKSAIIELQKNYNLFEEKAIKEFFYVKSESIKMFNKNRRIKKKC